MMHTTRGTTDIHDVLQRTLGALRTGVIVGRGGRIIAINDAAIDQLGASFEDLVTGTAATSGWRAIHSDGRPWPIEERWWDLQSARRRARVQVVTADGVAHVLSLEGGDWWVEATYD